MTQVKDLAGRHLGQRITITTANTTATGVLQGFRHDATAFNAGNPMRDEWVTGRRETTITLLPNQEIIANMGDQVVVHGNDTREPDVPRGWEHQGAERHCGCADAQELDGPSIYRTGNAQPATVHACDTLNAPHQAEKNGGSA